MTRVARCLRGWLRPALLFSFGAAIALYCGRRGFMPLDQSIAFDGGWRLLCGQVPLRDWVAPNGFTVHALQALFFAIGGVSWWVYCLHAAILNGLFAPLVDRVLRTVGAAPAVAFSCGAGSALLLTPPMGVPYMDTHAFFFSLLAIGLALEARRRESPGAWASVPLVLALAGLSKQVPSVFFLPVVLAIALAGPQRLALRRLGWLALGTLAVVGALGLLSLAAGVRGDLVSRYLFEIPAAESARRLAALPSATADAWRDLRTLGVLSLVTVPAALVAGLVLRAPPRAVGLLALAGALVGTSLAFAVITLNQVALALPPLFLAVGLAWTGLARTARAGDGIARRRAARALAVLLLVVAAVDAWRFHTRVNLMRSANDIAWDASVAEAAAGQLPEALAFLEWQVPAVVPYGPGDLAAVARFLAGEQEGFLLLGDASILYGITGKRSAAPSLWFHAGLTQPAPADPSFPDYESWLLARMDDLDVRYLVLEGRQTWNHTTLDDFPRLSRRVREKKTPRLRFGGFRIVDLGGSAADGAPERADQTSRRRPSRETPSETARRSASSVGAS